MDEQRKKLIGMRVRECRNEVGLSQEGLAEKLGMNRTNVANYEGGRVVPPGNVLLEMAELFGVTTDYLLVRTDDPNGKAPELDEKTRTLARDFQNMNSDAQDLMLSIAREMSKKGREAKGD